jgi:hypothetical protein
MKVSFSRNHFDRITKVNKTIRGIRVTLKDVKTQVLYFHMNRREIPRFGLHRMDATEKNHGVGNTVMLWVNAGSIGIRLELSLDDRVSADGIGPNQQRSNAWDLTLPDDLSPNGSGLSGDETAGGRSFDRFARVILGLGTRFATSNDAGNRKTQD